MLRTFVNNQPLSQLGGGEVEDMNKFMYKLDNDFIFHPDRKISTDFKNLECCKLKYRV